MSREEGQYVCAISGITGDPSPEEDDGLDDLPVGWTRIVIQRRQLNPTWVQIQEAKARIVEAYLEQMPPELHEAQKVLFDIQVAAQFASLESQTPKYIMDVDDSLDCSDDDEVTSAINEVRSSLGLEDMPELDSDMDEDE